MHMKSVFKMKNYKRAELVNKIDASLKNRPLS